MRKMVGFTMNSKLRGLTSWSKHIALIKYNIKEVQLKNIQPISKSLIK